MRLMQCVLAIAAVVVLGVTTSASAQVKKLKVGSNAPPLTISEWMNGNPSIIEQDKVYVVEFWATWCAPCKRSIPHLNALHNELSGKGVTIIGISNGEKPETVRSFVEKKGPAMSYLIGLDDGGQTTSAWMEAAGREGIPCAFIVGRDRKIAWIGNPLDDDFDTVLLGVASGSYDPAADKAAAPTIEAARKAAGIKNFRDAYKHYDAVIESNPKHFAKIAREKYRVMLVDAKDTKGAAEYGKALVKSYSDNPGALGEFAVMIVTDPELKDVKDVELASFAADTMIKVGGRSHPKLLDYLATVQFNTGKEAEAVETQKQAWMTASPNEKPAYKQKLDLYKAAVDRSAKAAQASGSAKSN